MTMNGDRTSVGAHEFASTWIENWPQEIAALSFPQRGVALTVGQIHAIGLANGIHRHCFENGHEASLADLTGELDDALQSFAGGAFVRLGSRSPKDTALGIATRGRALTGTASVRLLTSGSRRIAFDLRLCLRRNYQPWVFLRAWREGDGAEFRCFWMGGRLAGVSQYHHQSVLPAPWRSQVIEQARNSIGTFLPAIRAAWGKGDIVFDVWVDASASHRRAFLIELNPCVPATDPCLFSWQPRDFDCSLRIRTEAGIERHALE
jgi:hypothetical protein